MNTMQFDEYTANVFYNSETEKFKGIFVELNSKIELEADDVKTLKYNGQTNLNDYLDFCKTRGIDPIKPSFKIKCVRFRKMGRYS